MELCARCHKRVAVVFVTRMENGQTINEGICLKCAKELGIKPVNDILDKMGIAEDDLDKMDMEMENIMGIADIVPGDEETETSSAPAINFEKLFGGNSSGKQTERTEAPGTSKKKQQKRKYLNGYCINLTEKAKAGTLDRVIGRDTELERVIQILNRRQKNNPCLIGEPGVGKTAIAEALAQRICDGKVPYRMREKEVYVLDLTALVAGTQFRGQFEGRVKGLIDEVKSLGNIILVIDEVHNLVGAGDAEGSMNAANIMKPALSRGELQVIGATTLSEYRKYIEKDSALERRFQPVLVKEPNIEQTVKILDGIKKYYESFHGIMISDETVRQAVVLSERYITDRFLPDKAIDLIDEAASYLAIKSNLVNDIDEKRDHLKELVRRREEAETSPEPPSEEEMKSTYERIATLKSDEIKLSEELQKLEEDRKKLVLTTEDLAKVIEIWTGIPAGSISENEFAKLEKLGDRLRARIVGQDEAVDAVVRAIKRNRAGVSPKRKPVSFIFAGPTGVGKTELVKTIASDLFDSTESLIRLDMSEFMEKHSVSRIIGSPPGYVGYDEAGQLTEKIRRKPYSVVLFDEIEKAHPDVMNILLQILDDGRITDAHGKEVNFENTIIVMTTNAGSDTSAAPVGFGSDAKQQTESRTMKALGTFLRPEFINRVDSIITFNTLTEENFRKIARIMLEELKTALAEKKISFLYSEEVVSYIAEKSFSRKFGARNMRRFIESNVEDKTANVIIENYETGVSAVSAELALCGSEKEIVVRAV